MLNFDRSEPRPRQRGGRRLYGTLGRRAHSKLFKRSHGCGHRELVPIALTTLKVIGCHER